MKGRCLLFASFSLTLLLFASTASAACWTCSSSTGCCVEQAQGSYGSAYCSAIQHCLASCVCSNCQPSGSLCEGSGESECNKELQTCEENKTQVVPNGDPLDLEWLIRPPVSPDGDAGGVMRLAGCATVV